MDTGALTIPAAARSTIVTLRVARVDPDGTPWLEVPGLGAIPARCLAGLERSMLEAAVESRTSAVAVFEGGDPEHGIVLGLLGSSPATGPAAASVPDPSAARPPEAVIDGKRIILTGHEEVTLRCGKASITLTKAGKILIRGESVSSRASGTNRIRGGSVQIN